MPETNFYQFSRDSLATAIKYIDHYGNPTKQISYLHF